MLDDLLAVLWTHPHVHVDVGAIVFGLPRAEFYRYFQRIVEAGFSKRVMFGSDQMVWPGVIERSIQAIESAPFFSETQKRCPACIREWSTCAARRRGHRRTRPTRALENRCDAEPSDDAEREAASRCAHGRKPARSRWISRRSRALARHGERS